MILSDGDIKNCLKDGSISIDPIDESAIQPASVDLHLGDTLLVWKDWMGSGTIDPMEPVDNEMMKLSFSSLPPEKDYWVLNPGQFALGCTKERVGVNESYVAIVDGKSSLARLGLFVHITAGYIDPGNNLNITLEFFNGSGRRIKLYPGMLICQVRFQRLNTPCEQAYGKQTQNKYYGDNKPVPSKYYLNYRK